MAEEKRYKILGLSYEILTLNAESHH